LVAGSANFAKVSLSGIVNVYSLGGVWTKIRDSQDAWLKQGDSKAKTLSVDSAHRSIPWMMPALLFNCY
jgi:hypothetical protein